MDQSPTRVRTFFPGQKKVYPWGAPPIVSFRPRDSFPPISSLGWLSKTRRTLGLSLIPHCLVHTFSRVQTLEKLCLSTVPFLVLLDVLKAVWHLPLCKVCWRTLLQRSSTVKLAGLSKTLPWDHPIAQETLRCIAGKWPVSRVAFFCWQGWVPFLPFPYTLFHWF